MDIPALWSIDITVMNLESEIGVWQVLLEGLNKVNNATNND
jgi:hypothetical protein